MEEIKNQSFLKRFSYACEGIYFAWTHEHSFKTQLIMGSGALLVLLIVGASALWLGIFLLCIGMVLSLELINTALERWMDAVQPEYHLAVKQAKDCAAGAVLVASGISVLIFFTFLCTKFPGVF